MTNSKIISLFVVLALVSACASTKAYVGPTLPPAELATIQGASSLCNGSNYITKFDGQFEGQELQAPSGQHRMQVNHVSKPFIGDDPNTSFFPECVQVTGFEISFATVAPHTYWFYVDDSTPKDAQISVWQSSGIGPQGTLIPTQPQRLWSHRDCFIDGRYSQCFAGM